MDSPHTVMGLLKIVRIALDQNGPCEFACMRLFDMRSMNDVWIIKLLLFELNGLKCVWKMIC